MLGKKRSSRAALGVDLVLYHAQLQSSTCCIVSSLTRTSKTNTETTDIEGLTNSREGLTSLMSNVTRSSPAMTTHDPLRNVTLECYYVAWTLLGKF